MLKGKQWNKLSSDLSPNFTVAVTMVLTLVSTHMPHCLTLFSWKTNIFNSLPIPALEGRTIKREMMFINTSLRNIINSCDGYVP